MNDKIGFSMKLLDLYSMNIIKESVRYPYNMEHTLLNSVIWGTSLCIPTIHNAIAILSKRAKESLMWQRLYFMVYDVNTPMYKFHSEQELTLSKAREYISNRKNKSLWINYNFDMERFVYSLISTNRLHRSTNNKSYISN